MSEHSRMHPAAARTSWVALFFTGLVALFYAPLLLGLRTFPDGDFTHHFLPFSLFQRAEYLAGRLPVWNPYTYAGHPFLADVQAAVFYPLNNLVLLLTLPFEGAGARLYWLQVEAILHVALGGFFTYLLVRTLTDEPLAGILSGCTFAFSGYLTGYPPLQLAIVRTAIWLPLLLWVLLRAMRTPRPWRWWLSGGVVYATAFLAGHPQTFLSISYVVAAWVVVLFVSRGAGKRGGEGAEEKGDGVIGRTRSTKSSQRSGPEGVLGGLALFILSAVGLSAAQWWPSIEFTGLSVRADVSYEYVSGGFPLGDTWQMLMPSVLTHFAPLYVGVIGLGLALVAVGQFIIHNSQSTIHNFNHPHRQEQPMEERTRMRAREQSEGGLFLALIFFVVVTIVALLLSYGGNGFLYPLFYRFAPGWNLFRGQERAAYLVALGLSMLAGLGLAVLPGMAIRWRRLLGLTVAALMTAGVYAFGLFWQLPGRTVVGQWAFLGIAFVTLVVVGLFWGILWTPGWSPRRSWLLIGLTLANLFWANITTNLDSFGPVRKTILSPEMEALQGAVREQEGDSHALSSRVYNEFRIYEDYGMRLGVEDVWGSSPLRLARYATLHDEFPLDRLWELTGVEHLLTWRRELFEESELLGEYPQATDTTYLHRLTEKNPRARVVEQVRALPDEGARQLLADHAVDLNMTALIPQDGDPSEVQRIAEPGRSEITLHRLAPNRLHVQVQSEHGGLLVLSENWMPGWRILDCRSGVAECARTSLTPAAISTFSVIRANLTFIGIPVPAGESEFDLVYWPDSLRYGLLISGLTVLLLIGVAIARVVIPRRRPHA